MDHDLRLLARSLGQQELQILVNANVNKEVTSGLDMSMYIHLLCASACVRRGYV